MKTCRYFVLTFLFAAYFSIADASMFVGQDVSYFSSELAQSIGMKIWHNECAGTVAGLTSWNEREDFASLGIGHFIWYPTNYKSSFEDSFPKLIKYMQSRNVTIPTWLNQSKIPKCPWRNREEFLAAQSDKKMAELRQFLVRTIPVQVQYLMHRFTIAMPKILEAAPLAKRDTIYQELSQLLQSPQGVYALVDYVNFKGEGLGAAEMHSFRSCPDWGLLQVLEDMQYAPSNLRPLEAYAWAARHVLIRRVFYSAPNRHEEKWLPGWLKRVDTYLKY